MSNLINNAADLMSGGDDLTVVRDANDGSMLNVHYTHSGESCEYLRGMVEVITASMGLSMDNKSVIYNEVLRRITGVTITEVAL